MPVVLYSPSRGLSIVGLKSVVGARFSARFGKFRAEGLLDLIDLRLLPVDQPIEIFFCAEQDHFHAAHFLRVAACVVDCQRDGEAIDP